MKLDQMPHKLVSKTGKHRKSTSENKQNETESKFEARRSEKNKKRPCISYQGIDFDDDYILCA